MPAPKKPLPKTGQRSKPKADKPNLASASKALADFGRVFTSECDLLWAPKALRGRSKIEEDFRALIQPYLGMLREAESDTAAMIEAAVRSGPAALQKGVAAFAEQAAAGHETNTVTAMGSLVSAALRRELLLAALELNEWNLARTADFIGAGSSAAPVLRMIRDLGLTEEYEKARAGGRIKPGRPIE
jgi:hypothetical protein